MTIPLIELRHIAKKFADNTVLNGVNLHIFEGQITTIIGKSGEGKSVLLKHIIGLLKPDSGSILFNGKPITALTNRERSRFKTKFSYMFQDCALFDSMTVYDNIALPLREANDNDAITITACVEKRMQQLDIVGINDQYPGQLSGGMKKRVALARALVTDPEIILFDEPTTGLDPIRKRAVHQMIADYQQKLGFTGIIVSHEIPAVFAISQRIALIDKGKVIFQGSPSQLYSAQQSKDSNPIISAFIRGMT